MMSTLCSCIVLSLFVAVSRAGTTTPPTKSTTTLSKCSQFSTDPKDVDIYRFCRIFSATNIFDLLHRDNISTKSDSNWYLDWNFEIDFSNHSITRITLTDDYFGGKLLTSEEWPPHLQQMDLETPGDKTTASVQQFEGIWDWSTFTQLKHLQQFSLTNNNFSGYITNEDWNNIVSMPSLRVFLLAKNYFTSNFSEVQIANVSAVYEVQLMNNLFFGKLDTTMNGFFSKFPELSVFVTADNPDLGGHFANLDALSLTKLNFFEIENCQFSGFLTLSNDISLPSSLSDVSITNNSFEGAVDWNIFHDLRLKRLLLSNNAFEGTIDWQIIGDLTKKGLRTLELDNNQFAGYANFEYLDPSSSIKIRLDRDIMCDPTVYICGGNAAAVPRSAVQCGGKKECESTCKCSDGSTAVLVEGTTKSPQQTQTLDVETTEDRAVYKSILHEDRQVDRAILGVLACALSVLACVYIFLLSNYAKRKQMDTKRGTAGNDNNYLLMNSGNV